MTYKSCLHNLVENDDLKNLQSSKNMNIEKDNVTEPFEVVNSNHGNRMV